MMVPLDPTIQIRSFRLSDAPACQRLYVEGLIGGSIAENDTGFDIDDIDLAYMRPGGNHFWVAAVPGRDGAEDHVVGTVGVQHHDEGVGEIRRLRVAHTHRRRGIGSALIETALHFCQERQYLKITLDTYMQREPAIKLFEKFRFRPARSRKVGDKELIYFYLDLYMGEEEAVREGTRE